MSGADGPTGDQPTGDQPTGDQPTGDQPTGDQRVDAALAMLNDLDATDVADHPRFYDDVHSRLGAVLAEGSRAADAVGDG